MYDHFKDGSNANMEPMLENEFGIIAGQDLIDFDKLRNIYRQKDINDNASKSTTDGTIKGAGANEEDADGEESIYEKVVSNAQLAGIRKASLTKEHVQVNARANALTTEQLYKLITKGRMTSANDLLKR
jgi:lipopolysaccharide export system protein LptC